MILDLESETEAPAVNPCDNILYPLDIGHQWIYAASTGDEENIITVSTTAVAGNTATVDILNQSTGSHYASTVECAAGALTGFSAVELGFLFFPTGTSLILQTTSGIFAPAQSEWVAGDWNLTWQTDLLASGQMSLDDDRMRGMELVIQDSPVRIDWSTAGAGESAFETVTTPAGTFSEALRVNARARFDLMVKSSFGTQEYTIPAVLELVASVWYQPHVGLVKQRFDSAVVVSGTYTYELSILTMLELQKYNFSA